MASTSTTSKPYLDLASLTKDAFAPPRQRRRSKELLGSSSKAVPRHPWLPRNSGRSLPQLVVRTDRPGPSTFDWHPDERKSNCSGTARVRSEAPTDCVHGVSTRRREAGAQGTPDNRDCAPRREVRPGRGEAHRVLPRSLEGLEANPAANSRRCGVTRCWRSAWASDRDARDRPRRRDPDARSHPRGPRPQPQ